MRNKRHQHRALQRHVPTQRRGGLHIKAGKGAGLEMFDGFVGPAARWRHPDTQLGAPALCRTGHLPQVGVVVQVALDRAEAVQRLADAVANFLVIALVGKSAEQTVPQDQDTAVVLVDAVVVLAVVHAVVAGRDQNAVQHAHAAYQLGVHPVLVQQVDQAHDHQHLPWDTEHRQGQVEHPAE